MTAKREKNENICLYGKFVILQIILWCILLFFIVSIALNAEFINVIDDFMFNIIKNFRCDFVNNFALLITFLGETATIISFLILVFLILKKKSLPLIYVTSISALINFLLKIATKRARPVGEFLTNLIVNYKFPATYSFPSGHSQTGLVFYYVLAYILLNNYYQGNHKKLLQNLSLILPILIMLSRIILGVHFFTDVLCGAILGSIIITSYCFINKMHSIKVG